MRSLTDLRNLLTAVAVLEFMYFLAAMLPPSMIHGATGWVLTADGHWIVKILGLALLAQAMVAWMFRNERHVGIAKVMAFYQIASATADWVMWLALRDDGIFRNQLAQGSVIGAIATHYLLGLLLIIGIRRSANSMMHA